MRGKSGKAVCREIQARMGARFWNRRLNAYVWVVSVTEIHQEPTRGPQAKALSLSNFPDHNGLLVVTSENRVPLSVERVFTIHAGVGDRRGEHAHRTCTQFLVAVSGSWKIEVFRGSEASTFALDGPKSGVLIPLFCGPLKLQPRRTAYFLCCATRVSTRRTTFVIGRFICALGARWSRVGPSSTKMELLYASRPDRPSSATPGRPNCELFWIPEDTTQSTYASLTYRIHVEIRADVSQHNAAP